MSNIDIKITNKNGAKLLTNGKVMRGDINVTLDDSILPSGTLDINENGTYNVTDYESANVNVQPNLQEKEVTENGEVVADEGYDGLSKVVVNVESSSGGEDMLQARINATNSCYCLFYNYTGSNVDYIKKLDTSQVTDMSKMFQDCKYLTNIPLLDTSQVTNTSYMFSGCSKLTTIPQLDISKVSNVARMFQNCISLTSIPRLDTSSISDLYNTFYSCRKLQKIDISYFNTPSLNRAGGIFQSCYSLKALIIRGFGGYILNGDEFDYCYHILGTTNSTYNPNGDKDGYIYVPRNMVDTLKSATNWSVYADQIRALEDYTVDGTTTGELDETKI